MFMVRSAFNFIYRFTKKIAKNYNKKFYLSNAYVINEFVLTLEREETRKDA